MNTVQMMQGSYVHSGMSRAVIIPTWMRPRDMPLSVPPARPRQVLPSPRILVPSFIFFPKSTGAPPPKSTAAELGMSIGTMSQSARIIARPASTISAIGG